MWSLVVKVAKFKSKSLFVISLRKLYNDLHRPLLLQDSSLQSGVILV